MSGLFSFHIFETYYDIGNAYSQVLRRFSMISANFPIFFSLNMILQIQILLVS